MSTEHETPTDSAQSAVRDGLDKLLPASEFKNIAFPMCSKHCAAVAYFGVCECESVCPHKFDKNGDSLVI